MTTRPKGWARCKLQDLAEHMFDGPFGSNLRTEDYTNNGVLVARLENISRLKFIREKITFISEEKFDKLRKHQLEDGDILFSSFVDDQVRVCRLPDDLNQPIINKADVFCIRADKSRVDAAYLMYKLASGEIHRELRGTAVHGATRPRVGLRDLKQLIIDVPPLVEQGRIAAKIRNLFSRSERALNDLKHVDLLAARYKQAVLARILSEAAHKKNDREFRLEIDALTSGSRDWAKYYDRGTATFVLAGNVRPLEFDPNSKRLVDPPLDSPDARRSRIRKDDLLITIVGAGTGDICRVDQDYKDYFVCQSVALIRLNEPLKSKFFSYWFNSEKFGKSHLNEAIYGAARPHLSFEQLRSFRVPVVDADDAADAVRRIELAFTAIDRLVGEAQAAQERLKELDQAILAKALRGELVSQDPDDEPASLLLARAQAERAATGPGLKRGHRPRGAVA